MATGDKAAAAGLPVVPGSRDIRLGYEDINKLADAVADVLTARFAAEHAADPNSRGIFATNLEATRAGAKISVQTWLQLVDAKNAANTAASGPNGEATTIQSVLDLLMGR